MEKLHIFKRTLCLAMVMAIIGSLLGVGGITSVAAEEHSYDDLNLDGIFNEAPAPGIPESSDSNQSSNTVVRPRGSVDTGSVDDDAELSFIESNITVEAGETRTLVAMYNSADVALADADVVVSFTGGSAGSILFGEPVVTPISTGAKSGMVSVEATFIVTGTFVITLEAGADSSNPDTMASTKMGVTVEEASTVSGTPSIKAYAVNGADSVKVGGNVSILVTYYNGAAIDAGAGITASGYTDSFVQVGAAQTITGVGKLFTFKAIKAGAVIIDFSYSALNVQAVLTATETEQVRYFGGVSTIEIAPNVSGNFYNVGGLYVESFSAKTGTKGYNVEMNIYNSKNLYGAVCVYDSEGNLINVNPIEPHNSYATKRYDVASQGFEMYSVGSMANKYAYTNSKISTKTKVTLEVPSEGYIEITNDVSCRSTTSLMAYLYNAMDLTVAGVFYGASDLNGVKVIDVNANAVNITAEKVVETIWTGISKKSLETLKTRLSQELARDIAYTSIAQMIKGTRYILEENKINLSKIISDSASVAKVGVNAGTVTTVLNQQLDNAFKILFALSGGGVTYADLAATVIGNPANNQNILLYAPTVNEYRVNNGIKAGLANGKPFDIGVMLVTQQITNIDFSKETFTAYGGDYKVFDIFLYKDDSYYAAPSNVEIKVPVPTGYNKSTLKVYHQNIDGEWDRINHSIDGNYVVVSTEDFSLFAIVNDSVVQQFFVGTTVTGSGTVNGGGWYEIGDTVKLTGVANVGYGFEGWYESGKKISSTELLTFTAGSDRTIEAKFTEQVNVTCTLLLTAGTGGTVGGGGVYNANASVTVTATPNQLYSFDGWYDGTVRVSTNMTYTFKLAADTNLTAKFLYNPTGGYVVTVTGTAGGVVYGSGWFNSGDTAALIAIPYTGYEFDGWYENKYENNKETAVKVWTEKTYNFTVGANRTLNAVFKAVGTDLSTNAIYANNKAIDISTINTSLDSYTIEVSATDGVAFATVPVTALATLTEKTKNHKNPFVINVDSTVGSYVIPLNIAKIVDNFDDVLAEYKLKAEDVSFKLIISDRTNEKAILNALAYDVPFAEVIGSIVDFSMEIIENKTGKTLADVTQFSEAVERTIPMAKNTVMPERYGVLRYNAAEKTFDFVPHSISKSGNTENVVIYSRTNSAYVVVDNPVEFADLEAKHWAKPYIDKASSKKLVQGMGNNKYDPERAVTRAEFVQMIVNALQLPVADKGTKTYTDVNKGTLWYYDAVMRAKSAGLLTGFLDSYFYPDTAITREEMATILAAVVRQYDVPTTREAVNLDILFGDYTDMSKPYIRDIELVYRAKLMNGMGNGVFGPQGSTTRAQAATVQIRLLELLKMIDR